MQKLSFPSKHDEAISSEILQTDHFYAQHYHHSHK